MEPSRSPIPAPITRARTRFVVALASGLALVACADGAPAPPGPPLIFETDVRKDYTLVRACRSPGEHSGLNAYTVWVNAQGAASFSAIWQTPPAVTEIAGGAVIVKELYSGPDCEPAAVERWVAME